MRIAAEIQQALLPKPRASLGFVEAASASVPCRSIGGDFFDYLDDPGSAFGFTLGDVAGKGPPAALLSALMQGMFAAYAYSLAEPATVGVAREQGPLPRGIESRFVTIMLGCLSDDGRLTYCNGGHNPPFVIGKSGVRRLETGGPVIGLLEFAPFVQETVQLDPGDVVVIFSDGVSEAMTVPARSSATIGCWPSRRRGSLTAWAAWSTASWPPCARSRRARRRATTSP